MTLDRNSWCARFTLSKSVDLEIFEHSRAYATSNTSTCRYDCRLSTTKAMRARRSHNGCSSAPYSLPLYTFIWPQLCKHAPRRWVRKERRNREASSDEREDRPALQGQGHTLDKQQEPEQVAVVDKR